MFDASISANPITSLQQHPDFCGALRLCGQKPVVLDGQTPVTVLSRWFAWGGRAALISRVDLRANSIGDLSRRLCAVGMGHVPTLITPEHKVELGTGGALCVMTPAWVAEINLSGPDHTRLALQHSKWRNQLRRAQSSMITIQNAPIEAAPDHPLFRAELAQRKARNYRHWPIPLTVAYAQIAPNRTRLFTAHRRGRIIAQMLFLLHGSNSTYHIGHITNEGRQVCAHNLLLWSASNWLAERGILRLDLGLLDSVNAPGLVRFKLRSGAIPRELGGTWLVLPALTRRLA